MDSEWDTRYFVGINPKTTEYLVAKDSEIYSCATIRRLQDDRAYDPEIVLKVEIRYLDYVVKGSRSTPVGVRIHSRAGHNPDPSAIPVVPRRARLKPEDFATYGYTIGCPGCEQLQLDSSARRNHIEQCRLSDRLWPLVSRDPGPCGCQSYGCQALPGTAPCHTPI